MRLLISFFFIALSFIAFGQETPFENGTFIFTPTTSAQNITLLAVGDVLLHEPLQKQGDTALNHFKSLWLPVEPWIKKADIAYANLEGPVAKDLSKTGKFLKDPELSFDNDVYSSYPAFNYPNQIAVDLKESGFDVVSTANNHALDRGSKGADLTLEALNQVGLSHTGTIRKSEEQKSPDKWIGYVNTHGFHTAWIACAFGTNGIADKFHQVLNCYSDKAQIISLIHSLSVNPNIDAVVVTPHFGVEYETTPRKQEISLAHSFIDAGALLVLGSHPHVTQKWETYTGESGNKGLIVYSLGNFVSGQFQRVLTRASVMIEITLSKENHHTFISKAQWMPLEMVHQNGVYQVEPMNKKNPSWEHLQKQFESLKFKKI